MDSIKKFEVIKRADLNEEAYFTSLIKEALQHGLLSDFDVKRIQTDTLKLLAFKIKDFTRGESSSVRSEIAENIMQSNLFTISLYLKSLPSPDEAVGVINTENLFDIYKNGIKKIEVKMNTAKYLQDKVIKTMIKTENYIYNSTVTRGIAGFFKIYDKDFDASEIHMTADYPLYNPVKNLVGIEFMEKYIESLYYENVFCNYFPSEEIHHLLLGYDEEYKDFVFNIMREVLTCAVGCVLTETPIADLQLTPVKIQQIDTLFRNKTKENIADIILDASSKILDEMNIAKPAIRAYIQYGLADVISVIFLAVKNNKIQQVFISPKYPKNISVDCK